MHLHELEKEQQLKLLGVKEDKDDVQFPTQSGCAMCGGLVSSMRRDLPDEITDDIQLAYEVALVQYGYMLNEWDSNVINREIVPKPCTCDCPETGGRHDLEEVKDDGWAYTYECKDCGERVTRAYK